jgi:hypothetical protein
MGVKRRRRVGRCIRMTARKDIITTRVIMYKWKNTKMGRKITETRAFVTCFIN